jgi:hypothetical protein
MKKSEVKETNMMSAKSISEDRKRQKNSFNSSIPSQQIELYFIYFTAQTAVCFFYFIGKLKFNHFWLIQFWILFIFTVPAVISVLIKESKVQKKKRDEEHNG